MSSGLVYCRKINMVCVVGNAGLLSGSRSLLPATRRQPEPRWPCNHGDILRQQRLEFTGMVSAALVKRSHRKFCGSLYSLDFDVCFLADRTIGRTFVTGCRLSVICDVLYPGKTAGPICMKFSGKVWTDHGTT